MTKKQAQWIMKAALVAGDIAGVTAAVIAAYYARFHLDIVPVKFGIG